MGVDRDPPFWGWPQDNAANRRDCDGCTHAVSRLSLIAERSATFDARHRCSGSDATHVESWLPAIRLLVVMLDRLFEGAKAA